MNFVNKIVPVEQIPTPSVACPINNLTEIYKLCMEMQEICDQNEGVGLSAVQLGNPYRLFVIKKSEQSFFTNSFGWFLNCEYIPTFKANRISSMEGCLSLKDKLGKLRFFNLNRYDEVKVTGQMLTEDLNIINVNEILSVKKQGIVFQHEIDHQNGILISQLGKETLIW